MKREMRRFRQALSIEESKEILRKGIVAVLAVDGDDDFPYALPLNYLYHEGCVYFHSALDGHKIDALKRNPRCSLCVVDKDEIVPEKFTSHFRSVIAFGIAERIYNENEKIEVLKLLCNKYSPGLDPTEEIQNSISRVAIIRIRLEKITGKEAIELSRHRPSIRS